ncbi:MAG: ribosomal protection-like ABC-F family protein [Anaerolineae bacterium]
MLTVHHISKDYGIEPVLRNISFNIGSDDRIGLVGPNGSGKTTLMRLLAGQETPDEGSVLPTKPNVRIGYLAQGADFPVEATIGAFIGSNVGDPQAADDRIAELASGLAEHPDEPELQAAYDQALEQLAAHGRGSAGVLASLGLADVPSETPLAQLSGGQKTRLMLARVLLQEPDLLLLDEPTNHLDIEMLEWVEAWLAQFPGAALIVSHDRAFLDHTVRTILDLDPNTHGIVAYTGNYTDYLEQATRTRDKQMAAYRDQVAEIKRMRQDIVRTKEQARHVEITTTPRQPGVRRIAKKVAAKAKSREHRLQRYLDSDDRIERPKSSWQIKLEFQAPAVVSQNVLSTDKLAVGYQGAPALLSGLNLHVKAGERITLTGPNGAGKTSLLRTIAGRLPPLAGNLRLGASVKLGYMAQEQELLRPDASALAAIQEVANFTETEARNFLHYFLFEDETPLRPTRELSFGERARLQLALLVAQGSSFLLLDEPINHLDIPSRTRFEQALSSFDGTVLAVVHDRYFIERFASSVWTIEDGKVQQW